jgi:hypothetical protein
MDRKGVFTKILAIVGTVLVWLPVLAPFVFSVVSLIGDSMFRFDYLMPAELFPMALPGAGLLLWAALRARSHWKLIGRGLGAALVLLFGGQALAVVTGLASGVTRRGGWQEAVVLTALVAYALALVVIGVTGVRLVRDLYKKKR